VLLSFCCWSFGWLFVVAIIGVVAIVAIVVHVVVVVGVVVLLLLLLLVVVVGMVQFIGALFPLLFCFLPLPLLLLFHVLLG
jgi:hypothetical protein